MSEHGFHVHGPHDHALEHEAAGRAARHGRAGSRWRPRSSPPSARCSPTWAALTQANAGLYKNESAIKKTEASNQWNYYQAKSSKQNLAELAVELAPEPRKRLLRRRGQALQEREGRDQEGRREVRGRVDRMEQEERRADPPAPPLGPGDDGAADLDRDGGDRAAHQEPAACSTASMRLSGRRRRRSASSPGCTSDALASRRRPSSSARRQLVDLAPELGDLDLLARDRRAHRGDAIEVLLEVELVDVPLGLATVELLLERREPAFFALQLAFEGAPVVVGAGAQCLGVGARRGLERGGRRGRQAAAPMPRRPAG